MPGPLVIEKTDQGKALYCLTSHRRTLSETDIVNFVNLIGLHEPPFIDMDRKTSSGKTLVDLEHVVKNQHDQVVTVFTEKIIFDLPN